MSWKEPYSIETWTRAPGAAPGLVEVVRRRAEVHPGRTAFVFLADGEREAARRTYGQLDAAVGALAARLRARAEPGQPVLLVQPPGLDYVVAFLACLDAGVVAVPVHPPLRREDRRGRLARVAADAGARLALTTPELAPRLELPGVEAWVPTAGDSGAEAAAAVRPAPPRPDAPAFLQYTSGTTGDPRGVVVLHRHLAANEAAIQHAFGQSEESVVVGWLPLHHDMGLIGTVLQPLWCGGQAVLMAPAAFLQRPRRWLEAVTRHRATTTGGPNFAYDLCVRRIPPAERAGLDLSTLEVAFNGSEPVRPETLDRFAAAFAPCGFRREAFLPCYGLAEATLFVAGAERGRPPAVAAIDGVPRVGCGLPWAGERLLVVDPERRVPRAPGEEGELWVAGPSVAAGYHGRPRESAETFAARLAGGDGPWLRTGDLAVLAAGGELFVTGRAKDLVVLRGRNLHPQDLEATAEAAHPVLRLAGCAAFAVMGGDGGDGGGEDRGERGGEPGDEEASGEERLVVACEVERRREGEAAAAVAAVRRALVAEHQAAPHAIVALRAGTLPRTTSGKVRRGACRELWRRGGLTVLARSGETPRRVAGPGTATGAEGEAPLPAVTALAAAAAGVAPGELVPSEPLPLDSLQAVELRQVLARELGLDVPLEALLSGLTLDELERRAAAVPPAPAEAAAPSGAAPAVAATGEHPLTPGQRALWLLERLAPGGAGLHLAFAARVRVAGAEPRPADLETAFHRLVRRHPVLAASVRVVDGQPLQRLPADGRADFAVLPGAPDGGPAAARFPAPLAAPAAVPPPTRPSSPPAGDWTAALAAEAERPFDLAAGPLLRVRLVRGCPGGDVLLVVVHHLAADFASLEILVTELARELAGEDVPPPAASYAEHVHRQRELLAGPRGDALAAWWRRELAGAPHDLALPADRPAPVAGAARPEASPRGAAHHFRLPAGTGAALRRHARGAGTTPFAVLLAAWTGLLARYTGQRDLLVGTPAAGRPEPRFREVVGYFANLLPLRGDLGGDPGLGELSARCGRRLACALEHQDLPFPALVEAVAPERAPSRHPLVQAALVLEAPRRLAAAGVAALVAGRRVEGRRDAAAVAPLRVGALELDAVPLPREPAQLDLLLTLVPDEALPDEALPGPALPGPAGTAAAGPAAVLDYDPGRFDAATAERLARHFARLLAAGLEQPEVPLSRLPLLDEAERRQVLALAVGPGTAAAPTVPEAFAAWAARQPEAVALAWDGGSLSYGGLERRSAALARHLAALGAGCEGVVGVVLAPGPERVVAVLAALRAGAAYLALEPDDPAARRAQVLAAAGARLVVAAEPEPAAGPWTVVVPWDPDPRSAEAGPATAQAGPSPADEDPSPAQAGPFPAQAGPAAGEADPALRDSRSASAVPRPVHREAAAYVMFTSGSTGAPKGVVVPHRAVANLAADARALGFAPGRRVLHMTSLAFDVSAAELLLPLATGAALCLAPPGTRRSGRLLASAVHRLQADTLMLTPPVLGLIPAHEELAPVRTIVSGGERCPEPLARRFAGNAHHGPRLYNAYGPTEATVWSTRSACLPENLGAMALLGQPVRSTRVLLLGPRGELVPPGAVGELVLAGEGLARGYLGRPAATAEAFVPDPWAGEWEAGEPGARLYRTGDLARRRADGEVELVGRRDAQLKVRGHRVEPAEVEAALTGLPGVAAAAAGAHGGRLVAWVVPEPGAAVAPERLRAALASRLPAHLVPNLFVPLDRLPLTATGKLDRRALPAPPAAAPAGMAPRTALEGTVAGLWRDELGLAEVGVETGFFELGGTSLGLARIHGRLCEALQREIPIADLFSHVTVASLAAHLATAPAGGEAERSAAAEQAGEEAREMAGNRRAAMAHHLRRRRAAPPSHGDPHHD